MKPSSSKADHLFESIKEVAHLIQTSSSSVTQDIKFHMHNSQKSGWDEIWLLREGMDTVKKQPFIRVSLSGLSNAERIQLATLVRHHNTNRWPLKIALKNIYLRAKDQLCKLQLAMVPLRVSPDEL